MYKKLSFFSPFICKRTQLYHFISVTQVIIIESYVKIHKILLISKINLNLEDGSN